MSSALPIANVTETDSRIGIACVYALSGAYGPLPRFLYYVTLVLAIFGRRQEWLVIGALVSSLTYAGTTAIHAMALINSKSKIFDLDSLGAWAILSTAALSYIVMIHWSETMRSSKFRVVMIVWGALIGLGLIFSRVTIYDQEFHQWSEPCYSSSGLLLTSISQLAQEPNSFNCTYACFNVEKPMRGKDEIVAVSGLILYNRYFRLSLILVGPIMYAAYAAISYDSRQHSPSQMCTRWIMCNIKPRQREDAVKLIWNASHETWYGGYFALFHYVRGTSWGIKKIYMYLVIYPWIILGLIMDVLSLPFLVINVVLNELHLLKSDFPINEAPYNVGQWSTVVNSALVVIAALINKGLELWEARKIRKRKQSQRLPTSEFQLHRVDTDATLVEDVEVGSDEGKKSSTKPPESVHLRGLQEESRGGARSL